MLFKKEEKPLSYRDKEFDVYLGSVEHRIENRNYMLCLLHNHDLQDQDMYVAMALQRAVSSGQADGFYKGYKVFKVKLSTDLIALILISKSYDDFEFTDQLRTEIGNFIFDLTPIFNEVSAINDKIFGNIYNTKIISKVQFLKTYSKTHKIIKAFMQSSKREVAFALPLDIQLPLSAELRSRIYEGIAYTQDPRNFFIENPQKYIVIKMGFFGNNVGTEKQSQTAYIAMDEGLFVLRDSDFDDIKKALSKEQ